MIVIVAMALGIASLNMSDRLGRVRHEVAGFVALYVALAEMVTP